MVEMRDELTFEDFVSITRALRTLRPDLKEHVCIGVEKPQAGDLCVVFHLMPLNKEMETVGPIMISTEYIRERFGGTGNVAERDV